MPDLLHQVLQQGPAPATVWGTAAPGLDLHAIPCRSLTRFQRFTILGARLNRVSMARRLGCDGDADAGCWGARHVHGRRRGHLAVPGGPRCCQLSGVHGDCDHVRAAAHRAVERAVWRRLGLLRALRRDGLLTAWQLCSGQSNMQFTVLQGFNATAEIAAAANFPFIRLFTAALISSNTPENQLLGIEQPWSVASPAAIGNGNWSYFSAVCWFYGRDIFEKLNYPIGMIDTDWGGLLCDTRQCWQLMCLQARLLRRGRAPRRWPSARSLLLRIRRTTSRRQMIIQCCGTR